MSKYKRYIKQSLLILSFVATVIVAASTTHAQTVTQGYQSDVPLQKGMMVRLKSGDGTKVQAVAQADEAEILGVVVSSTEAPVSLSNTGAAREAFVANTGQHDILVSTQGGAVKVGDYITISSLAGIGMKADSRQQYVVGKALDAFDGTSRSEGTAVLKTSTGDQSVSLGRVRLEISVAHNPKYHKDIPAGVPKFLGNLADIVTDQPVSAFRIYASTATVLLTILVAGLVLFAGVRSGMIAIGRNPLAKKTIFRNLIQVTLMALIIFVIGAIAVYLLLRV